MKLRIDDNQHPIIYIKNKLFKDSKMASNFIKESNILPNGTTTNFDVWSKQIQFEFRNTGVGSPRSAIANYIKMNYFRRKHNAAAPFYNEKYFDSAFCSIDLPRLGELSAINKVATSAEPVYVREPNNSDGTGNFELAMQNGAYWDNGRVLFYAHLQSINETEISEKEFINTYNRKLELSNTLYKRSGIYENTEVLCRSYTIGNNAVPILSVNLFRSKNVVSAATMQCKEHAMFLGLTVNEVKDLRDDTQFSNFHDRFIYLEPDQNNPYTPVEGRYFKYNVKIQGVKIPGTNQDWEFERLEPSAGPITVYSRDNQFFHSEGFSLTEAATAGQNRIEFHVFHDGCIKITDNKDMALLDLNTEQIHYVYFEEDGTRHDVMSIDLLLINKMGKGVHVTNVTSGYLLPTIDYTPYNAQNVNAKTSYVYPNGDVITNGKATINNVTYSDYKYRYPNTGKKTFIVHLEALAYASGLVTIDFTYALSTRRFYCRPEVAAAFIGALKDVGDFSDAFTSTVPFNIYCNGSCYENGTSFPSTEHNNGNALDTLYQNNPLANSGSLSNTVKLARDQSYVNAINKFGSTKILRGSGTNNPYSTGLTVATNGGSLHDDHLHAGEFVSNDCQEEL